MNKTTKIVIAVVAIIAVIALAVAIMPKPKTNLEPVTSGEELAALVDKVYGVSEVEKPMVMTQEINVTDNDAVRFATGLENGKDLEYVVISEAVVTSQAYSMVLVKVKDGVNIEAIAKEMNENIDARKWICVTAEKVLTTTSGDIICLVMSNEQTAKAVYNNFKTLAGNVGEEYERTVEDGALPEDMLVTDDTQIPAADPSTDDTQIPAADPTTDDTQIPAADPTTDDTQAPAADSTAQDTTVGH